MVLFSGVCFCLDVLTDEGQRISRQQSVIDLLTKIMVSLSTRWPACGCQQSHIPQLSSHRALPTLFVACVGLHGPTARAGGCASLSSNRVPATLVVQSWEADRSRGLMDTLARHTGDRSRCKAFKCWKRGGRGACLVSGNRASPSLLERQAFISVFISSCMLSSKFKNILWTSKGGRA
jgi:hypothetical protein